MNTKILLVKALLLYKKNEQLYFLELTRAPNKKFAFMGDLPGGKVDVGESLLEAIKREINEETGLVVPNLQQVTVYDWQDGAEYREHLYCTMVDTQEIMLASEEHVSYRWIEFDKIDQSTLHPNLKKIIEHEKERIISDLYHHFFKSR